MTVDGAMELPVKTALDAIDALYGARFLAETYTRG
jgi:hypothetical protein